MTRSAPTASGPRFDARVWAGAAALALALAAPAVAQSGRGEPPAAARVATPPNSALVRATAPPGDRAYVRPIEAVIAADLDHIVTEARTAITGPRVDPTAAISVALDAFAAGRNEDARAAIGRLGGAQREFAVAVVEPFLLLSENKPEEALRAVRAGADDLPESLAGVAEALVLESAGRTVEAAAAYARLEASLNTTPFPRGKEPESAQEYLRMLDQGRTAHALYRAALAQHRIDRRAEAQRLYGLVGEFASQSADLLENQRRLERRRPPLEPALDARRGLGRMLFFVADVLGQEEGIQAYLRDPTLPDDLAAPRAATLAQFGLLFDPAAHDWILGAAGDLESAGGLDGAARLLARVPADSVFAADAQIQLAELEIKRRRDAAAAEAAQRAVRLAGDRWSVYVSAADVLREVDRDAEALAAANRAVSLTRAPRDRAVALFTRAYVHRYAARLAEAATDARAALALDASDNSRMITVSLLMDNPDAWAEAVAIGRQLFAERPDSVDRLNGLGYTLIQRPEGLEEGYRLLWRGFALGENDYPVIDSLGWAYYQYGAFEEALALIQRANELSRREPNAEVLDHLGDVLWRLERQDEAREAWRQALAARPEQPRRRQVEAKLRDGLTTPAPVRRPLPQVDAPTRPAERAPT